MFIQKGDKVICDNIDLVKNKILKFESPEDFYTMLILQRKKDHPDAIANDSGRTICSYDIHNMKYLDDRLDFIKELCEHFTARAYIRPQVRSCKTTNRNILKYIVDQLDNFNLSYTHMIKTLIDKDGTSRAGRVMLDLDYINKEQVLLIYNDIVKEFENKKRKNEIDNIIIVPTFHGYHIVAPGFDPRILQKFRDDPSYHFNKDTWKSDHATILYAAMKGDLKDVKK